MRPIFLVLVFVLTPLAHAAPAGKAGALGGQQTSVVDVVSVYNGGYFWGRSDQQYSTGAFNALSLVNTVVGTAGTDIRFLEDKKDSDRKDLVYELAAPATIESFRIRGVGSSQIPRIVEFAVSQLPDTGFQTIATHEIPKKYRPEYNWTDRFDFSIPVARKISARYVRLTMRESTLGGAFRLDHFNAYGRFDEPAKLRKDFSGMYSTLKWDKDRTGTDADFSMNQKDGRKRSFIVLHQQEGRIQGCYVYVLADDAISKTWRVQSVEGKIDGGVEGNLFRFMRTHAKGGRQRPGVITLSPDGAWAHLAMLNEIKPGDKEDGYYRLLLSRVSDQPVPCSTSTEKEKTPADVMAETIAQIGKVQLYGVNFDFDSDVLRPESGAVLNEVVKLAKANPDWKFEIGGHTDSQGSDSYNQNLSERRAASVVRYLTQAGVAASRLTAKGYGESRPLIPETNDSEAARAQNRRVELVKKQ